MGIIADTPTRGRPRDPARDEAILDATLTLVAECGYDRTTVDAIATRAGVSKPTIYRRWPHGKDELIAAAVCSRKELEHDTDTGSLRGDLLAVVGHKIATMKRNVHLAAGLSSRLRESPELATVVREQILDAERVRFAAIVDRAVARGELQARPAALELITDVAPSLAHARLLILGEELDESFATEVVDHILLPALRMSAHPTHPEPDQNR